MIRNEIMKPLNIGLLREGRIPHDRRVALTPEHCLELIQLYPHIHIFVQPSHIRCFPDEDYARLGFEITEDLSNCDVLLGVKEVQMSTLLANKTYFFFSHTIKKQLYNRSLLQTIVQKNIRLIDYECITDLEGNRMIAFGRYAGIVGAYNGILTYGQRYGLFQLKRAYQCVNLEEVKEECEKIALPPIKILITGRGRVAKGAREMMSLMNIPEVTIEKTKELKAEDIELLKKGSYTSITRFERAVDRFDNANAQLSQNKLAVMIKTNPYLLSQNYSLLENTIYLTPSK